MGAFLDTAGKFIGLFARHAVAVFACPGLSQVHRQAARRLIRNQLPGNDVTNFLNVSDKSARASMPIYCAFGHLPGSEHLFYNFNLQRASDLSRFNSMW